MPGMAERAYSLGKSGRKRKIKERPRTYREPALLQRCLGAAAGLGELELGDGHEDLGARFEIGGLEEGLLLARAEGAHHGKRVDERLVRRLLDALPIDAQL